MNGHVEAVVPKAKVEERVVTAMNGQMAAYLKYYLMDCGLDEGFVTRLVVASCCPTLVAEINQYEWNEEHWELKSIKENDSGSCGHPQRGATLVGISPNMVDSSKC